MSPRAHPPPSAQPAPGPGAAAETSGARARTAPARGSGKLSGGGPGPAAGRAAARPAERCGPGLREARTPPAAMVAAPRRGGLILDGGRRRPLLWWPPKCFSGAGAPGGLPPPRGRGPAEQGWAVLWPRRGWVRLSSPRRCPSRAPPTMALCGVTGPR